MSERNESYTAGFGWKPKPDPAQEIADTLRYAHQMDALNEQRLIEIAELTKQIEEANSILWRAIDRDKEELTLLQVVNIAANGIYWRNIEVEGLREREQMLREVLTPFANLMRAYQEAMNAGRMSTTTEFVNFSFDPEVFHLRMQDFRNALSALAAAPAPSDAQGTKADDIEIAEPQGETINRA